MIEKGFSIDIIYTDFPKSFDHVSSPEAIAQVENAFRIVTYFERYHTKFNIYRAVCGPFGETAQQLSSTQCTDAVSLTLSRMV